MLEEHILLLNHFGCSFYKGENNYELVGTSKECMLVILKSNMFRDIQNDILMQLLKDFCYSECFLFEETTRIETEDPLCIVTRRIDFKYKLPFSKLIL